MELWRVNIQGIAFRFVEAESAESAVSLVAGALLDGMDLIASPTDAWLNKAYSKAGAIQRDRMLIALDGLSPPHRRARDMRADRRKLARRVLADMKLTHWARRQVASAPRPADPDAIARLLESGELSRMQRNLQYLHEDQVRSTLFS